MSRGKLAGTALGVLFIASGSVAAATTANAETPGPRPVPPAVVQPAPATSADDKGLGDGLVIKDTPKGLEITQMTPAEVAAGAQEATPVTPTQGR
ncbi:hypothetical protein [Pseudonocardia sp. EC080619-01]|uniref:hypothetical protein n=1 Tax=Pseudonocardia sp. EC080619-01 TaxID=1096856 RepID=UPI000AD4CF69|nr:hypothetical protein [Pseudonocardia sp. EC080619-01]